MNKELKSAWDAYQLTVQERETLDDAMQYAGPEGVQAMFRNGPRSQAKLIKYAAYLDAMPSRWDDLPGETASMLARCATWVVGQHGREMAEMVRIYQARLRSRLERVEAQNQAQP